MKKDNDLVLREMAEHIVTLNHEVGSIKKDVAWLKWLVCALFIAVIVKMLVGG